ncbi:MAG: hypothetical protein JEZ11_02875 [Desulfobacterales bacterium]|nr:hypothetical protein [Desulfobacterales bacterium]
MDPLGKVQPATVVEELSGDLFGYISGSHFKLFHVVGGFSFGSRHLIPVVALVLYEGIIWLAGIGFSKPVFLL